MTETATVKPKRKRSTMLPRLRARGFDQSYYTPSGYRVKCSQCEAVAINGIACHETNCPNQTHDCAGCDTIITGNRYQKYCEDCS